MFCGFVTFQCTGLWQYSMSFKIAQTWFYLDNFFNSNIKTSNSARTFIQVSWDRFSGIVIFNNKINAGGCLFIQALLPNNSASRIKCIPTITVLSLVHLLSKIGITAAVRALKMSSLISNYNSRYTQIMNRPLVKSISNIPLFPGSE